MYNYMDSNITSTCYNVVAEVMPKKHSDQNYKEKETTEKSNFTRENYNAERSKFSSRGNNNRSTNISSPVFSNVCRSQLDVTKQSTGLRRGGSSQRDQIYTSFGTRKLSSPYKEEFPKSGCVFRQTDNTVSGYWGRRTFTGLIRSMQMKKRHLITVLFVIQLLLVTPCLSHECGNNPMKQVLQVAKRTGRTLSHVLTLLKEIDNPAYDNLSRQFRTYAACLGLVDTGYFRKRSEPTSTSNFYDDPYRSAAWKNTFNKHTVVDTTKDLNLHQFRKIAVKKHKIGTSERILDSLKSQRARNAAAKQNELLIELKKQNNKKDHYRNKHKFKEELEKEFYGEKIEEEEELSDNIGEEEVVDIADGVQDLENPSIGFDKKNSVDYRVDRLKKWLYGPYQNYMNNYYLRYNLLWPMTDEEK